MLIFCLLFRLNRQLNVMEGKVDIKILIVGCLCLLWSSFYLSPVNGKASYLFEGKTDQVVEFKGKKDLEENAKSSSLDTWFVMFYSPYCGHCSHYAPTFIEIAKRNIEMYSDIKFGAVSCASYSAVCTENSVAGYPTVYAYDRKGERLPFKKRSKADINEWIDKQHESIVTGGANSNNHINLDTFSTSSFSTSLISSSGGPIDFIDSYLIDSITSTGFAFEKEVPLSEISTNKNVLNDLRMYLSMLSTLSPTKPLRDSFYFLFEESTNIIQSEKSSWILDIRDWNILVQNWKDKIIGVAGKGLRKKYRGNNDNKKDDGLANAATATTTNDNNVNDNESFSSSSINSLDETSSDSAYRWFGCGGDLINGTELRGFTCGMWSLFHILSTQTGRAPPITLQEGLISSSSSSSASPPFSSFSSRSFYFPSSAFSSVSSTYDFEKPNAQSILNLESLIVASSNSITKIDGEKDDSLLDSLRAIFAVDPAAVLYTIKVYMGDFFGCEYCKNHFLSVLSKCQFGACVPSLVFAKTESDSIRTKANNKNNNNDNNLPNTEDIIDTEKINYDHSNHELYRQKSTLQLYQTKPNYALVLFFWKLHNFITLTNIRRNVEEGIWNGWNGGEKDKEDKKNVGSSMMLPVDLHSLTIEESVNIYRVALWPTTAQCPGCWNSESLLAMAHLGVAVDEEAFDENINNIANLDMIYQYIMMVYGEKQGGYGVKEKEIEIASSSVKNMNNKNDKNQNPSLPFTTRINNSNKGEEESKIQTKNFNFSARTKEKEEDDDIDMLPVFVMCFGTMFLWVAGRMYYLHRTGRKKKNDSSSFSSSSSFHHDNNNKWNNKNNSNNSSYNNNHISSGKKNKNVSFSFNKGLSSGKLNGVKDDAYWA